MSSLVELNIFSAIDNPQWTLTLSEESKFAAWSQQHVALLNRQPREQFIDLLVVPDVGYTGFTVTKDDEPPVHVYGGGLFPFIGGPDGFGTVDEFLFSTNRQRLYDEFGLDASVVQAVHATRIRELQGTCPIRGPHCGTMAFPGNPSRWEERRAIRENRCYSYANNVLTQNLVLPPTNDPHRRAWTPQQIRDALTSDGLNFLGYEIPGGCPRNQGSHYIAALLHTPGRAGDYHFLRLDSNGTWSHKNGASAPSDSDAHRQIDDLCVAEFSTSVPYLFAGYFESTPEAKTRIEERGA